MKKPDLGKESIQTFFLNHTEKLVIGLCFAGLVVLAWTGLQLPSFNTETPVGLSTKASGTAVQYMAATDNWEKIAPYRKASRDPLAEVTSEQGSTLDVSQFSLPMIGGPLVKIPGLRGMPEIIDPQNPQVFAFMAPVLIKPERKNSKLDLLGKPGAVNPAAAGDGGLDGGRGGNRGGGGDGGAEGGTTAGEGGGRGGGGAGAGEAVVESTEPKIPGSVVSPVMAEEFVGVRPAMTKVETGTETFLLNIVQVSATVSISEQNKKFREALESTRGYYPDRDRAFYYRPQLERQEEGSDQWQDITERSQVEIPAQYGAVAQEVVSPEIYSGGITSFLPPITGFDYRILLSAIGQPLRSLRPAGMFADKGEEAAEVRPAVSIWSTNNPKTEEEEKPADSEALSIVSYFGSNMSIYDDAAKRDAEGTATTTEPKNRDVLVRAFDLQPPKGKKVRYRLTIWVEDPNNTATDLIEGKNYFQTRFGAKAGAAGDLNSGAGGDRGGSRGAPGAGGASRGGMAGGRAGGGASSEGGSTETGESGTGTNYVLTKIQDEDISPEARQRLREQRALRSDMLKRAVSNPAASKEIWKTYCIASKPLETDWIAVEASGKESIVALGHVHEPRMNKIGNVEVPRDEPAAEMVGVEWSEILGAWVPGYRKEFFRRGESANFSVDFVHLLNPVDSTVLRLEKDRPETLSLETELHIATNQVLVDIAGGREITLKNSQLPNEWEGQRDPRPWTMPGETLIMDASGKLTVHSEFDDLKEFRNRLFIPDQTDSYGRAKPVAPTETDANRGSGR